MRWNVEKSGVQPAFLFDHLLLGLTPRGEHLHSRDATSIFRMQPVKLTSFQRAAIYLSDAIARARIETAEATSVNHARMQHFQIAVILVGAITTILISVKAMSTESKRWSITIGILAMVFSSVGTGTSALNSFYNPREAFIRHQRSLSMLKQSHMVLATEVTGEINADGCTRMDGDRGQRVKDWSREWSRRLALILTASDTTAQGDSKGPGDGKSLRPGESGGSITVENGLPPSS